MVRLSAVRLRADLSSLDADCDYRSACLLLKRDATD